jgi:hypothetical protein
MHKKEEEKDRICDGGGREGGRVSIVEKEIQLLWIEVGE